MPNCLSIFRLPCLLLVAVLWTDAVLAQAGEPPAKRPVNVLFIAVDDLRPQLGCYGHAEMYTPNIDRLSGEGRRFDHQYVQVPTCGASRCAMLTSQYPQLPATYDNNAFETMSSVESKRPASLPELFRKGGYKTVSIGKISHSPDGKNEAGSDEVPFAWDEVGVPLSQWKDGWAAFFAYEGGKTRIQKTTPATEHADVSDDGYPDGLIADAAIAKLSDLKDTPFFLAVGFFKPHLPFCAPKKYWDLYKTGQIPPASNPQPPKNIDPSISLHKSGELLGQYTGFAEPGVVSEEEAENLRHSYAACVSYTDAQIGRVLQELDRLGLRENTIVVLWGDHGWHLGEEGLWGKHTLHEIAMRSPLIIRTPNMAQPGQPAEGLVEAVDIYPTLAQLCGLKAPADIVGKSFVSLLNNAAAPGKPAVYGFWRSGRGHSIRNERYRLVLWTASRESKTIVQTELYDLETDPNETVNIAAQNPAVVRLTLRATPPNRLAAKEAVAAASQTE